VPPVGRLRRERRIRRRLTNRLPHAELAGPVWLAAKFLAVVRTRG